MEADLGGVSWDSDKNILHKIVKELVIFKIYYIYKMCKDPLLLLWLLWKSHHD